MSNSPWQGRMDKGVADRWHQLIIESSHQVSQSISLIGFSCDEGVRRNHGRTGAKLGPNCIREMLANLVYSGTKALTDLGDIECVGDELEEAQYDLSVLVADTIKQASLPVVLGGGHEVAWGTFQGIRNVYPKSKVGIINFDAHFDLRPLEPKGSSGTPFRQAALWSEDHEVDFDYFVLGINPSVNTPLLFDYAKEKNVRWQSDLELGGHNFKSLSENLRSFCEPLDYIYLTICLDVFPAAYAPGVSAPASIGVDPNTVFRLLDFITDNYKSKITALEIAEMNPSYDIDNRTARLAARLVHHLVEKLA